MSFNLRSSVYGNKMRAELEDLAREGVQTVGNAFSTILVVKGEPGPAELGGGPLLSGADGQALRAALDALGYAPEDWAGVACWDEDGQTLEPALLRKAIVTLGPLTIVATDAGAATVLGAAYDLDLLSLGPNRLSMVCGMRVLCLDGFEASLGSMRSKQVMWAALKLIPPLGEPY